MRSKLAEERPAAILAPVVAALFALETTEIVLRTAQMFAPARIRWDAVAYPFVPLGVAMILPGLFAARTGRAGRLMLACGLGLVAVLMIRFRGLWTWDGSFDHYWASPHPWMISLVVGAMVGLIAGRPWRGRGVSSRATLILLVGGGSLAFLNWTLAHVWAGFIDSFFPPTRLFATGGILIALGTLWYVRTLDAEPTVA